MRKSDKHIIKKIQVITYIIDVALIVGAFVLDANNYINLTSEFVFIMFGFILLPIGIFGIINHEVSLGNAKPLEYNKNSLAGKIANIIIVIIGVFSLAVGIFAFIS